MTCEWRDEFGFCIPWQWGWPGCKDKYDRHGRPKPCKCPPDLETARQHYIKTLEREKRQGV